MAKIILKNEHYEDTCFPHYDKPYYIPVNRKIWLLVEKYCCDLSSEIFDMFISDAQYKYLTSERAKNFYITTWLPPCIVKDILDNLDCVNEYAFALHDCDIYEDSTPKKDHCHIILQFTTNYAFSKVASEFHTLDFRRLGDTWFHEFNYLTHDSEKCRREGKYQYSKDIIVSSNLDYIKSKAVLTVNDIREEDILNDMLSNMSYRQLAIKYDKRFTRNIKNLEYLCERIRIEENIPKIKHVVRVLEVGADIVKAIYDDNSFALLPKGLLLKGVDYIED